MLTISNPRDLLLARLGDLLYVERRLSFDILPTVIAQVSDPELGGALAEHLEQTKRHVEAATAAFRALNAETSTNHDPVLTGMEHQHEQLSGSTKSPVLADLVHAQAAIGVEHHEIAGYGAVIAVARALGLEAVVAALEPVLADERAALERLEGAAERLGATLT